jgi:hypothetical protein
MKTNYSLDNLDPLIRYDRYNKKPWFFVIFNSRESIYMSDLYHTAQEANDQCKKTMQKLIEQKACN